MTQERYEYELLGLDCKNCDEAEVFDMPPDEYY